MYLGSELLSAQVENLAADPTPGVRGRIFMNTTSGILKYDDGLVIRPLGGASPSTVLWQLQNNSPIESLDDATNGVGFPVLDFDYVQQQELWTSQLVPLDYVLGTQIKLRGGKFFTPVQDGAIRFKTDTYLVKPSNDVISSRANVWTSQNAEVAINAPGNLLRNIGDIDLTDVAGAVRAPNQTSVPVAAGDLLLIKFYREVSKESVSAIDRARFLRMSMVYSFTS